MPRFKPGDKVWMNVTTEASKEVIDEYGFGEHPAIIMNECEPAAGYGWSPYMMKEWYTLDRTVTLYGNQFQIRACEVILRPRRDDEDDINRVVAWGDCVWTPTTLGIRSKP